MLTSNTNIQKIAKVLNVEISKLLEGIHILRIDVKSLNRQILDNY